jgi:hypothetical protein
MSDLQQDICNTSTDGSVGKRASPHSAYLLRKTQRTDGGQRGQQEQQRGQWVLQHRWARLSHRPGPLNHVLNQTHRLILIQSLRTRLRLRSPDQESRGPGPYCRHHETPTSSSGVSRLGPELIRL